MAHRCENSPVSPSSFVVCSANLSESGDYFIQERIKGVLAIYLNMWRLLVRDAPYAQKSETHRLTDTHLLVYDVRSRDFEYL